jgi:hypothetical protein
MNRLVLAFVFAACGKSSSVDCEALRDQYLARGEVNVQEAVGGMAAGSDKDALLAQGNKELAMAKERFVGACKQLGPAMDASCFDKANKRERRCKDLNKQLDRMLYVQ